MANPYISLMYIAWQYAKEMRGKYLLVYGMFIISNLLWSAEPMLWGWFVSEIQQNGLFVLFSSWVYVGAYMGLQLAAWAFHGTARIMERQLAFDVSQNFLQELYHKALHLPVKWHQDHHSGSTINRVRKAYEALRRFFDGGFAYVNTLAKFIFSFGAMIYFAEGFGAVAIALGVLIVWVIMRFDKPFIKALEESNEKEHVVSSTLFDSLSNIITVITLRLESRMEAGLMQKVMQILKPFRRSALINEWKWFTVDVLVSMTYCTILLGYIYQNYEPGQAFLLGGLVTLVGYVHQFTGVFHNVAWQYTDIVQYHTDVKTASTILDAWKAHHLPEETRLLPQRWSRISIRDLHFMHELEGEKVPGLHGLNLDFEKGKRIAFVGESGSGKSTLLALLRGLYNVRPGVRVMVDDKQFPDLSVLSSYVTLFPQEPEIFENTIAYNITLGLPFSQEEIERVCRIANFEEVIAQLPKGLDSHIQEKGVNLSGGQKQRLALARGIFAAQQSDIILLDEPTSSVDPKSEVQIYERFFDAFGDRLIVSALHRLHLLQYFDYVYVLRQGEIVAEGTFESLKAGNPIFQELWKHLEASRRAEIL